MYWRHELFEPPQSLEVDRRELLRSGFGRQ